MKGLRAERFSPAARESAQSGSSTARFPSIEPRTAAPFFYQSLSPEGTVESLLSNSILWGDTATSGDEEIAASIGFATDPTVPLVVSSSIVQHGCDDTSDALTCGSGIVDVDPQYVDAAAANLRAQAVAVVDAGDDTMLPPDTLDLDGDDDFTEPWSRDRDDDARVSGASVDLGRYEAP